MIEKARIILPALVFLTHRGNSFIGMGDAESMPRVATC